MKLSRQQPRSVEEDISHTYSRVLLHVVGQNNVGVKYFEARDFQAALNCFRDALQCITSPVADGAPNNFALPPLSYPLGDVGSAINPFAPILKAQLPNDDTIDVQTYQRFTQAMEVVSSPGAYSDNSMVNEMTIMAIIIWNMAVVYHCTSKGPGINLRKAYTLYLKSWSLIENFVCHGSKGNHMVDFFTQALLNNMSGCCLEQDDHADARFWSDQLIAYAQSMEWARSDSTSNVSARLQEQTDHFILNAIMLLQCRPSFLAPAA